jgi:hypothetical protein
LVPQLIAVRARDGAFEGRRTESKWYELETRSHAQPDVLCRTWQAVFCRGHGASCPRPGRNISPKSLEVRSESDKPGLFSDTSMVAQQLFQAAQGELYACRIHAIGNLTGPSPFGFPSSGSFLGESGMLRVAHAHGSYQRNSRAIATSPSLLARSIWAGKRVTSPGWSPRLSRFRHRPQASTSQPMYPVLLVPSGFFFHARCRTRRNREMVKLDYLPQTCLACKAGYSLAACKIYVR